MMRTDGFAWQKWLAVVRRSGRKMVARWNEASRSEVAAERKRTSRRWGWDRQAVTVSKEEEVVGVDRGCRVPFEDEQEAFTSGIKEAGR
jgi:hypothetical protein